jgi:alkylation response protein AidB-like acyl-CoA dehydrogenase
MLQTTAEPDGEHYVIRGRKWFITGADGASLAIIMAKVPDVGTRALAVTRYRSSTTCGIDAE